MHYADQRYWAPLREKTAKDEVLVVLISSMIISVYTQSSNLLDITDTFVQPLSCHLERSTLDHPGHATIYKSIQYNYI